MKRDHSKTFGNRHRPGWPMEFETHRTMVFDQAQASSAYAAGFDAMERRCPACNVRCLGYDGLLEHVRKAPECVAWLEGEIERAKEEMVRRMNEIDFASSGGAGVLDGSGSKALPALERSALEGCSASPKGCDTASHAELANPLEVGVRIPGAASFMHNKGPRRPGECNPEAGGPPAVSDNRPLPPFSGEPQASSTSQSETA